MPGPISSLPPTKKRKVESTATLESIKKVEKDLTHALANNGSLNPLADLLHLTTKATEATHTSKGIYALYRVFVLILTGNKLLENGAGDEKAKIVKNWVLERLNEFVMFLVGLLQDEEKTLRISALQILFSLQKHLSTFASASSSDPSRQPQFHIVHFKKIVNGLLVCPPSQRPGALSHSKATASNVIDPDIRHQFHETWFSVHDDVRWFFLREVANVLNSHSHDEYPHLAQNLLIILEPLDTFPTEEPELNAWWVSELGEKPPKPKGSKDTDEDNDDDDQDLDEDNEEDDWRKFFDDTPPSSKNQNKKLKAPGVRLHRMTLHQSLHSLESHRAVFTRAWLTLLPRLEIDGDKEKSKASALRVLNIMHRGVLPHLTRAILVMDWVGNAVDYGGSVGLLALNALFTLIKDYNLDYPSFYTRLYAFLTRDVLHLKHRARFFRLTEIFLSSTHLPAQLLASFIKRLARLSLSAPPAAIVMLIPFTYNILKRHPALMVMIHRTAEIDEESKDPFLPNEPNPNSTQAIDSSLWELISHRSHYHSAVSTLAKIFSEPFTKPNYSMEDFLDHTYGTLFDTDIKHKIKRDPPLTIEIEQHGKISGTLFPQLSDPSPGGEEEEEKRAGVGGDAVAELWVLQTTMFSATQSLTSHLRSLHTTASYSLATQHPFLKAAANGTLSHPLLALWLSQDRIYAAHAYPRFIGSLISRIPFSTDDSLTSHAELLNQRILKLLVYSLDNIIREINFFSDTAKTWDLDMECWRERKGTRDYTAEMARVSASPHLEDGLIFLWAMERVYLDAWTFVHRNLTATTSSGPIPGSGSAPAASEHPSLSPSKALSSSSQTASAIASFAHNWSCPEFVEFVDNLAKLVDDLGIRPGMPAWKRAEDIWARVVELEVGFWPEDGEEITMRAGFGHH
ncbi:hypothetical protein AX16_007840 [Volvariella volvacea WC 439]|nr:hypothetical protein AX16_007840 [Volvariella volvacea WC 439]